MTGDFWNKDSTSKALYEMSGMQEPNATLLKSAVRMLDRENVYRIWLGDYVRRDGECIIVDGIAYSFKKSLTRLFLDASHIGMLDKNLMTDRDLMRAVPRDIAIYLQDTMLSSLVTNAKIKNVVLNVRRKEGNSVEVSYNLVVSDPRADMLSLPVSVVTRVNDADRNTLHVYALLLGLGIPRKPERISYEYDSGRLIKLKNLVHIIEDTFR